MRSRKLGSYGLALSLFILSASSVAAQRIDVSKSPLACQTLKSSFPLTVSFPGSEQFAVDIDHYADSSEQNATCSVQPESAADVSTIIKIIGRYRSPFAVKSGGHDYRPQGSSTPGVHISLSRFKGITYDPDRKVVSLGPGLTWQEVFEQLEPQGIMVAGGRFSHVGVGGYSLGGGYSWKTNQVGLLIDTIISYDVVLPPGQLVHVTNTSYPDLFFALKGGQNNFGIVTNITVEAYDQTLIYAGSLTYPPDAFDALNQYVSNFSHNNTDPKAQIEVAYFASGHQMFVLLFLFYDAPEPAPGIYDEILSIPTISLDVKTRTFADFHASFSEGGYGIGPFGAAMHVVPTVQYPKSLLDEMAKQSQNLATRLTAENNGTGIVVSLIAEPFLNHFSYSRGGAYPHPPGRQVTPATSMVAYQIDQQAPYEIRHARQAYFAEELKKLSHAIQEKAVEEGVSAWDDILYPNYALPDTPLELLYGENIPRLREIAAKYDPKRVMSLTGGFKFL